VRRAWNMPDDRKLVLQAIPEKGQVSERVICKNTGLDLTRVVQAVHALVEEGLVERKEDIKDRRHRLISRAKAGA
jgi:DNA-binding MarR family transcriptional regulator